jgi:hypothetical protein
MVKITDKSNDSRLARPARETMASGSTTSRFIS